VTVSSQDPMGLADFTRVLDQAKASIDGLLPPLATHARQMTRDLNHAARRSKEQADAYSAKATAAVNFERVAGLVRRGALTDLTPREARAAARRFLDFEQPQLRALLEHRPSLGAAFARQLFAEWERGHRLPRWSKDVSLLVELKIGMPVRPPKPLGPKDLLSEEGPAHIARTTDADGLASAFNDFCNLGLSPRWAFTHHAALKWMFKEGDSAAVLTSRIRELLQWEHAGFLLPLRQQTGGSIETRISSVAAILARLVQFKINVPPALETTLVDATFGDPRNVLSKEWEAVRQRSLGGFEAFTLGLIREDLKFFFSHAMKEEKRGAFWLKYLGSIRRTICILDPETHRSVSNAARALDENARLAARRALRTDDVGVSAFCLVFDNWVAVEFSDTGNASFLYKRADFEREILPASRTRPRIAQLKQKELAAVRLVHRGDWERAFKDALWRSGIQPDSMRW